MIRPGLFDINDNIIDVISNLHSKLRDLSDSFNRDLINDNLRQRLVIVKRNREEAANDNR